MGTGVGQIGLVAKKNNTHLIHLAIIKIQLTIWMAHARLMIFAIITVERTILAIRPDDRSVFSSVTGHCPIKRTPLEVFGVM
jgi:hypothetical protein